MVQRESTTETKDLGLIHRKVKPKTLKYGFHSFPGWRNNIERNDAEKASFMCGRKVGSGNLTQATQDIFSVSWPRQITRGGVLEDVLEDTF